MIEIATSLLDIKRDDIVKKIYEIETAKTDYFHIDVMDGKFVKNNNVELMMEYAEYINNISNVPMEVHLMVDDIQSFVKAYLPMNPSTIMFHLEACNKKDEDIKVIQMIKDAGVKVGICISPNTPVDAIYDYLPFLNRVLVMTVEPGKGGQKLLTKQIKKIEFLSRYIYENDYEAILEADGGINADNAKQLINAGCEILVSGHYIISSKDYKKAIAKLREADKE